MSKRVLVAALVALAAAFLPHGYSERERMNAIVANRSRRCGLRRLGALAAG
jgi:hypothetical protein